MAVCQTKGWFVRRMVRNLAGADGRSILLKGAVSAEKVRRSLCQRQLLLQKPKKLQGAEKTFCRLRGQITSNFTSVTPNRRRIFIRARSAFSRSRIAGPKPVSEIVPAMYSGRTRSHLL